MLEVTEVVVDLIEVVLCDSFAEVDEAVAQICEVSFDVCNSFFEVVDSLCGILIGFVGENDDLDRIKVETLNRLFRSVS